MALVKRARGFRGFLQGLLAGLFQPVMAARASAALRRRFRQPGSDQLFVFHPVERGIDRAARDFFGTGQFLDLGMDGDAIGIVAQRQHGGQHDLLELS